MSKKIDRALYGPSWFEVIFGALLSIVLGIALAAVYLVAKPVAVVKELPAAEAQTKGTIYLLEGSHDATKGRQWKAKHQQFMAGHSVMLSEDELNAAMIALASPAPAKPEPGKAPAPGKKGEVAKKPEPAKKEGPTTADAIHTDVAAGVPNFRIRDGEMQVAVPVAVNALSLNLSVMVQARGGFEKQGEHFVFTPSTLLIGSLPVDRIPVLASLVMEKIYASQPFPTDIVATWGKLNQVSVDGAQLKLDAP